MTFATKHYKNRHLNSCRAALARMSPITASWRHLRQIRVSGPSPETLRFLQWFFVFSWLRENAFLVKISLRHRNRLEVVAPQSYRDVLSGNMAFWKKIQYRREPFLKIIVLQAFRVRHFKKSNEQPERERASDVESRVATSRFLFWKVLCCEIAFLECTNWGLIWRVLVSL